MVAYDSANPAQKAETVVTVTVARNEFGPRFSSNQYDAEANESFQLGDYIAQVNATDRDMVKL